MFLVKVQCYNSWAFTNSDQRKKYCSLKESRAVVDPQRLQACLKPCPALSTRMLFPKLITFNSVRSINKSWSKYVQNLHYWKCHRRIFSLLSEESD